MKRNLCCLSSTQGQAWFIPSWWGQIMITLMISWLYSAAASGQTQLWDKTYGSAEGDCMTAFQQTSDGGYILG